MDVLVTGVRGEVGSRGAPARGDRGHGTTARVRDADRDAGPGGIRTAEGDSTGPEGFGPGCAGTTGGPVRPRRAGGGERDRGVAPVGTGSVGEAGRDRTAAAHARD